MSQCRQPRDQASDFRVVLGEHNRAVEEGTEKIIDVVEIIMHERYNRSITDNDMALFRLAEDVQYTRSIKPICLPRDDVTDNMMCITAGWGHTLCEWTTASSPASVASYVDYLYVINNMTIKRLIVHQPIG